MSATNDAQVEIATIHHTEGAEIIKKLLEAMKDQKKTSCDEKALTPEALGELQKHVFCEGNGVDDFDDGDLRDLLNRLINDNASITGKENDDLHSRIFKQFSNALRTTFEPCTNRDAFQDLNCEFNLALPWQWFLPDDRIENTSERGPPARNKAKQKKYGKLNDDQPLEKNDLSPYDICIVWSIKEDDEKIKKCKKCIEAAGLIVYTEEATVRKIYDKEAKDYTIMCVGIGDAPEQFKGNEHVPPLVYDYAKSEKQPSYRTERLLFEAHRTNYTLPLNSTIIEDCAHRGTPRKLVIKGDRITNSKGLRDFAGEYFEKGPDDQKKGLLTPLHTWETFLLQRHRGKREKEEHVWDRLTKLLYEKGEKFPTNLLSDLDETRLLWSILNDRTKKSKSDEEHEYEYEVSYYQHAGKKGTRYFPLGAGLDFHQEGKIVAYFPISYSGAGKKGKQKHGEQPTLKYFEETNANQGLSKWDFSYLCSYENFKERLVHIYEWTKKKLCTSKPGCYYTARTCSLPLDELRKYFGEQTAMYFAFLNHMTYALAILSVFALLVDYENTMFDEKIPYRPANKTNYTKHFVSLDPKDYRQVFYDHEIILVFAAMVAAWSTWAISSWAGRQATLAFEWNTESWEQEEEPRKQFLEHFNNIYGKSKGGYKKLMRSGITGEEVSEGCDLDHHYSDPREKFDEGNRKCLQYSNLVIVITLVCLAIIPTFGVVWLRALLTFGPMYYQEWFGYEENGMYTTQAWKNFIVFAIALLNYVQIKLLGNLLTWVAQKLTDWEHHRTDTQYEDALILKSFAFQFLNNFGAFMYTAYVQEFASFAKWYGGPGGCTRGCELMLGRQVFNVFLIKLIVGNSLELWYSKVYSKAMNCTVFIFKLCGGCCFFKHNRKVEHKITKPNGNGKCASIARDFASQNTYSVKERAADYIEAVILFGYVSLFSISAPLMVPFALISVVLESQVDAYKLKRNYLRPMPRKAQDIGIIEDIFKLVAWISVFSNIYIATLVTRTKITDQLYDKYGATGKFLAFVIAEHLMIFIKSVISYLASATPLELEIQKERQNFVQNQIVESLLNANQVKFKVKAKRKKLEAEPEQNKAPANADESIPEEGKTRAKIRPKRSSSLRRRKSMVLL